MLGGYHKNTKKGFKKSLVKGIIIFLKKNKIKSTNTLVNNLKIFLKKRKTKCDISLYNNIKIIKVFLKMKKQRLIE